MSDTAFTSTETTTGWKPDDRSVFAVVPTPPETRRMFGTERRYRGPASLDFWSELLRQTSLVASVSEKTVRAMWAGRGKQLVWGLSVDRDIGRSAKRAAVSIWPDYRITYWPFDDHLDDPDATVARRYFLPKDLSSPLHSPSGTPDHPMARVQDVMSDHPNVNVELRVDLMSLLIPHNVGPVLGQGGRVLLRVVGTGQEQVGECETVAERLHGVLNAFWATPNNWFAAQAATDDEFDQMWKHGTVDSALPAWDHTPLHTLLGPPPASVAQMVLDTDLDLAPPQLSTFDPRLPGSLMPLGVLLERDEKRLVGVPWGEGTDALVEWILGPSGWGKTSLLLSKAIALAETGKGFLFLDPCHSATDTLKKYLADHADRVVELDIDAVDSEGQYLSAGWNPLDVTVVPAEQQRFRIEQLLRTLPGVLFSPGLSIGSTHRAYTVLSKSIECLLHLNQVLPAEIQANIFCVKDLLLDESWKDIAVASLPADEQLWWSEVFPTMKQSEVRLVVDQLETWQSQTRVQALLGASQSTLRWPDIVNQGKIALVNLSIDGSGIDALLPGLVLAEIVAAFKGRSVSYDSENIQSFHLFLDDFQSYASASKRPLRTIVQELRKFGAKTHISNQSMSALPATVADTILGNRTHLACGRSINRSEARKIIETVEGDRVLFASLEPQQLLELGRNNFVSQVAHGSEKPLAFLLQSVDPSETWAHLRSDEDISAQVAENTGLAPVSERLAHYRALPDRIAKWLKGRLTPADDTV